MISTFDDFFCLQWNYVFIVLPWEEHREAYAQDLAALRLTAVPLLQKDQQLFLRPILQDEVKNRGITELHQLPNCPSRCRRTPMSHADVVEVFSLRFGGRDVRSSNRSNLLWDFIEESVWSWTSPRFLWRHQGTLQLALRQLAAVPADLRDLTGLMGILHGRDQRFPENVQKMMGTINIPRMCCSAPLPCDTSDTGASLGFGLPRDVSQQHAAAWNIQSTCRSRSAHSVWLGSWCKQTMWLAGVEIIQVVLTRHFLFHELIH